MRYLLFALLLHSCTCDMPLPKRFANHRPHWGHTEFVWNFGIMTSTCNKGVWPDPFVYFAKAQDFKKHLYKNVKAGDILFVKCNWMDKFARKYLPKNPFVVVIIDGDESFPSNCPPTFDVEEFLANPNVIHVFAQNCDYNGPSMKVSPIPIGMDFHTKNYIQNNHLDEYGSFTEQEIELKTLLQTLPPTSKRKKLAFADFHLRDTTKGPFNRAKQFGASRTEIFDILQKAHVIEYPTDRMKRSELWKKKGEYAFSISPYGNGLDCYRTWEDLILGCIVIVKSTPLDPLYEGLPVVIVSDWSEVTQENMDKWLLQYGDAFTNPIYRKKLTNAYWIEKIEAAAEPYKNRFRNFKLF